MQVKIFDKYILVKADVPEFIGKDVVKDVNVGGIKLQYKVSTVKALVFNLFGKQKIIPVSSANNETIKTFLRPYKVQWDKGRNRLPKSLWGKNSEPLTNLWIELELDFTDLGSGVIIPKRQIRDTNITKHFTRIRNKFFISKK